MSIYQIVVVSLDIQVLLNGTLQFITTYCIVLLSTVLKFGMNCHGGDSIDTTCAVVRDVTAYIAVVRVFRFSSEYYGCRYTNSTHVKAARDCI